MVESNTASTTFVRHASHFFEWWREQLWECLPATMRARITRRRRPVMISIEKDQYWPASSELAAAAPLARTAVWLQGGGDVALVLEEANGFRRDIELPLAVENKYAQVLMYEIDRLTPLRASELYYDFRLKQRNLARDTCTIELVAAPKLRVTPLIEMCQAKNINVTRLFLSPSDVDTTLNLMDKGNNAEEDTTKFRKRWAVNLGLLALCGLLIAGLIIAPLWQMRQYVIALQPIEVSAKVDAETASALQQQLEKHVSDYNLLLARKHGSPLAVQVLDDLSKRLPEDTWAQTLEIKAVPDQKKEVIIQGETGSGGKILQIVQESPLLKEPEFKAAMTRVAADSERFHIVGQLTMAEMPKQLLLSDSGAVVLPVPVVPVLPARVPLTNSKTVAPAKPDVAAKPEAATKNEEARPPTTEASLPQPKAEPVKVLPGSVGEGTKP